MADVVIPNEYGQVTFTWSNADLAAPITVTCGYYHGSSGDTVSDTAEALFLLMVDDAHPADPTFMRVGWTFEQAYCLQRSDAGVLTSATYAAPVNGSMTGTDGLQPPYSPLVVSKTSALAGKKFRGRMYPPMTYAGEASVSLNGNIETVVALPQIRALWSGLWSAWHASTTPPVILHTDSTPPTSISNFLVRPVVATQRRRKAR
jgi:hypothetical protein